MKPLQEISETQAQQLMSLLRDGELSAEGAERLNEFLKRNPEAVNWMESLDIALDTDSNCIEQGQKEGAIAAIQEIVSNEDGSSKSEASGTLLRFPAFFRPVAAAAAIAVVGTVTWLGLRPSAPVDFEPNIVEFVSSDIPDSSTYVYSDEESGWTVVWVDRDTGDYESQG